MAKQRVGGGFIPTTTALPTLGLCAALPEGGRGGVRPPPITCQRGGGVADTTGTRLRSSNSGPRGVVYMVSYIGQHWGPNNAQGLRRPSRLTPTGRSCNEFAISFNLLWFPFC